MLGLRKPNKVVRALPSLLLDWSFDLTMTAAIAALSTRIQSRAKHLGMIREIVRSDTLALVAMLLMFLACLFI